METPRKNILVVDDDELVRDALVSLLEIEGYEVTQASDGQKGLRSATEQSFDLVITDIVMPDLEGLELIIRLRRDQPRLKIIALSGSSLAELGKYLEIARRMGANRAFPKPFDAQTLLQAVRELTNEPAIGPVGTPYARG